MSEERNASTVKWDYALNAFLLVLICYLLQWVYSLMMRGPATGYGYHLRMLVMHGATILLPAALYIRLFLPGFGANHRALSGGEVLFILLAALVGLPALNALNGIFTLLLLALRVPMVFSSIPEVTNSGLFAASLLSIALMPGVAEELLFRGCVMNSLRPYGTRRAILLSALLFAMMHGILQSLPVHFLMGVVLGLLYFWTGSLQAPILYHLGHNAFSVLMTLWSSGASTSDTEVPLTTFLEDPSLLAGTAFGLLMLMAIFGGLFLLCLRTVQRRSRRDGFIPVRVLPEEAARFSKTAVVALVLVLVLLSGLYLNNLLYAMGAA